MKKLEIIIRPEKLEEVKQIVNDCQAKGLMISSIMGYGNQKGRKQMFMGNQYNVNILPKTRIETVTDDDTADKIIKRILAEISTGNIGDGKIFVYDVEDVVRIRTGERGENAL